MICVKTNRIMFGDQEERILRWEVRFNTPLGLCKTLDEAVRIMEDNGLNPLLTITAVPFAVSQNLNEAWVR